MSEPGDGRVAVYIDFDNIVISRYDQVHGRSQFQRDRAKAGAAGMGTDPKIARRLAQATVDLGAVIDFASSFGTLVLDRAYADWSATVNSEYRGQLVGRAVDLVQLFPAAAYAKNGADIRLAVDAVEDLFRLPDLTHVVIVAGDSDYIALAQRCKRLGRYVVGIGMAGSTSKALAAACDEFVIYDDLPGVAPVDADTDAEQVLDEVEESLVPAGEVAPVDSGAGSATVSGGAAGASGASADSSGSDAAPKTRKKSTRAPKAAPAEEQSRGQEQAGSADQDGEPESIADRQASATRLLERAMQLGHEKDDAQWLHSSTVKAQIKRMDPSFSEKSLGFRSFSDFLKSRDELVDLDDSTTALLLRSKPQAPPAPRKRTPRRASSS